MWWKAGKVNLRATLDFLGAGASSGTVENTQLKMMVLGRSEAGKTSMINALVAGTSRLTRVDDRTLGIDQHMLEMRLDSSGGGGASIGPGDQVWNVITHVFS